jgi:hypothetical protein
MLGNLDASVAMRALRTTKTTSASPEAPAEPRGGDHASLGRLLRLIGDPRSDESHVILSQKDITLERELIHDLLCVCEDGSSHSPPRQR